MQASELEQFRSKALAELNRFAVDSFKENIRITTVIEDKAQKTITVAGIFLSAGLAFSRPGTHNDLQSLPLACFLLATVFLIASIIASLSVMRVKPNASLPSFDAYMEHVLDLCNLPSYDVNAEIRRNSEGELLESWRILLKEQTETNRTKAHLLSVSQALLVLAVISTSSAFFTSLYKGATPLNR